MDILFSLKRWGKWNRYQSPQDSEQNSIYKWKESEVIMDLSSIMLWWETSVKKDEFRMNFMLQGLHNKIVWLKVKNRISIEAARTMLGELKLPIYFWGEAIKTAHSGYIFDNLRSKHDFISIIKRQETNN